MVYCTPFVLLSSWYLGGGWSSAYFIFMVEVVSSDGLVLVCLIRITQQREFTILMRGVDSTDSLVVGIQISGGLFVVCASLGQQVAVLVNAGHVFKTNAHANASKCFQCGNEAMYMKYTVRFKYKVKSSAAKKLTKNPGYDAQLVHLTWKKYLFLDSRLCCTAQLLSVWSRGGREKGSWGVGFTLGVFSRTAPWIALGHEGRCYWTDTYDYMQVGNWLRSGGSVGIIKWSAVKIDWMIFKYLVDARSFSQHRCLMESILEYIQCYWYWGAKEYLTIARGWNLAIRGLQSQWDWFSKINPED